VLELREVSLFFPAAGSWAGVSAERLEAALARIEAAEAKKYDHAKQWGVPPLIAVLRELAGALEAIATVGCMQRADEDEFWCKKDGSAHSIYCPRGLAEAALSRAAERLEGKP